jgi:hypothetical protein
MQPPANYEVVDESGGASNNGAAGSKIGRILGLDGYVPDGGGPEGSGSNGSRPIVYASYVEGSTGGATNVPEYGTPTADDGTEVSTIRVVNNAVYGTEATVGDASAYNVASAAGGAPQCDLATGSIHNRDSSAVTYAIPMEGVHGAVHKVSSSVRTTADDRNAAVYGITPVPEALVAPARRATKRMHCERPAPTGGTCTNNPVAGSKFCLSHTCPVAGCKVGKSSSEGGCSLHLDIDLDRVSTGEEGGGYGGGGINRQARDGSTYDGFGAGGGEGAVATGISRRRLQSTYAGFEDEEV